MWSPNWIAINIIQDCFPDRNKGNSSKMVSFDQIKEFDSTVESWTLYTEHLEQFFLTNGITEADRQRAIFLTIPRPATYALLRNLLSPVVQTSKTLQEIIEPFNAHFNPAPSEIIESIVAFYFILFFFMLF